MIGQRIAVVAWSANRLDIFAIGGSGQMYHKGYAGNGWWPSQVDWEPLGGQFTGAPTVASWAPNRLDIFARGHDSKIYHISWNGGSWSLLPTDWRSLGGQYSNSPAVAAWSANRLDLFAHDFGDGQMFHKVLVGNGNDWWPSQVDWEGQGHPRSVQFVNDPAVASSDENRLDIFVLGSDSQMYHKAWDGNHWHPSLTDWEGLGKPSGGDFISPPAVASWGPKRLDIFAIGSDAQIYHRGTAGNGWWPLDHWEGLGGDFLRE